MQNKNRMITVQTSIRNFLSKKNSGKQSTTWQHCKTFIFLFNQSSFTELHWAGTDHPTENFRTG